MTAGILTFRLCDREYDCENCLIDLAMRRGSVPLPESAEDLASDMPEAPPTLLPQAKVESFMTPPRGFVDPSHLYLRVGGGGNVRIWVDTIARRLLGDLHEIDLPEPETRVRRSQKILRFRGEAGEVALPSPIAGRLLARNERLLADPTLLRPGRPGPRWLADLRPMRLREDLARLFYGRRMRKWWREEIGKLKERLTSERAIEQGTLPDGGELDPKTLEVLSPELRRRLVREFLLRKGSRGTGRC